MSNDVSNTYLDRVQVVPLTSNTDRVYPSECLLLVKGQQCKAMADQLKTVSIKRCRERIVKLSNADIAHVESIIRLQLGLL